MGRKPRKPTEDFGYIAFGKNGKVSKHMSRLSSDKEEQEIGVVEYFLSSLRRVRPDMDIVSYKKLPEADHDFLLCAGDGGVISLQVTEIAERGYAFEISKEEYNSGAHSTYLQKSPGGMPRAVDMNKLDSSIKRAIERKIEKHYDKGSHEVLWLLIFSTSSLLHTEYYQSGQRMKSKALTMAQEYVRGLGDKNVFDQIWCSNLMTSAVRIWPED